MGILYLCTVSSSVHCNNEREEGRGERGREGVSVGWRIGEREEEDDKTSGGGGWRVGGAGWTRERTPSTAD